MAFKDGPIATPTLSGTPCSHCGGVKLVPEDPARGTLGTCDLCQGTGEEPSATALDRWEVYVLESCVGASFKHPFDHHTAILSGEPFRLKQFPSRLIDEGLLDLSSVGCDGPAMLHTVRLTRKGYAMLLRYWDQKRNSKG